MCFPECALFKGVVKRVAKLWSLWVLTGFHGVPWVFMGFPGILMGVHGFSLTSMGFSWVFMDFHGFAWAFMGLSGIEPLGNFSSKVCVGFYVFQWTPMGCHGFSWVPAVICPVLHHPSENRRATQLLTRNTKYYVFLAFFGGFYCRLDPTSAVCKPGPLPHNTKWYEYLVYRE